MREKKASVPDAIDCAQVMWWLRAFIEGAWIDYLPRAILVDSPKAARIKLQFDHFIKLGIVDVDLKVKDELRELISEVAGNRNIGDLTSKDYEIIASRYDDWFPDGRLDQNWHLAAYAMRDDQARNPELQ